MRTAAEPKGPAAPDLALFMAWCHFWLLAPRPQHHGETCHISEKSNRLLFRLNWQAQASTQNEKMKGRCTPHTLEEPPFKTPSFMTKRHQSSIKVATSLANDRIEVAMDLSVA